METRVKIINISNFEIIDQWLFKGHAMDLECFRHKHITSDGRIVTMGDLKLWENLGETITNKTHSFIGYNYLEPPSKIENSEIHRFSHLQKIYNLGKGITSDDPNCHSSGLECYPNSGSRCKECYKVGTWSWSCQTHPAYCPYDLNKCNALQARIYKGDKIYCWASYKETGHTDDVPDNDWSMACGWNNHVSGNEYELYCPSNYTCQPVPGKYQNARSTCRSS